ncbi:MAG: hypothetical protein ACLP1X_31530 [Polyangiaceae bacterium]
MEHIAARVLVVASVMAMLYALQAVLGNRAGSEAEVAASLSAVPRALGWFVALEYFRGIDNRTFVVLFTKNAICGAWTRGVLVAPLQVTPRWRDPLFYPRPAAVAKLRGLDIESSEFLKTNRANFQIRREDVEAVEHTTEEKWGMGRVPYSGRLILLLKDGRRRDFVLLGDQDGPALVERLRAATFGRASAAAQSS